MNLVVMIPAFNEEKTIGSVIDGIPRKIKNIKKVEVLVIDDGSTDNTVKEAKKARADKIVSHPTNRGLGAAFKTGIQNSLKMDADIIINIDADGQFDPKDIPKLIQPILDGKAEVAVCTRFSDEVETNIPFVNKIGNRIFTKIVNLLVKGNFTDTQCGFRAYSKEAALRLTLLSNFTYTQEVFLELCRERFRIKEVPLKVKYYKERESKLVKNPILYGIKALTIIVRTIRDFAPLAFFGSIGLLLFIAGFAYGLFILYHYLTTGFVSPYIPTTILTGVLIMVGFQLIILALMADMFERQKKIMEEILYYEKLKTLKK